MDFIDYMVCITFALSVEAMICQMHYVRSSRKIYKIMDAYRMAPDNEIVAADYKKLTNNILNPVIIVARCMCYGFGLMLLLGSTFAAYRYFGI